MTLDLMLTIFITVLTVVDPLGLIPVYLPIAQRFSVRDRNKIIYYSLGYATFIAVSFLFFGRTLFHYLNIHYTAISLVGGILLFLIGMEMIYAKPRGTKANQEEKQEAISGERGGAVQDVAVFPLAIPMLAGPGTIATLVMFASKEQSWQGQVVIFVSLIVAFLICAVVMRYSEYLLKLLGQTGINVLDRVMGIILSALAVQFMINALREILQSF